jgi:hypothetical protein
MGTGHGREVPHPVLRRVIGGSSRLYFEGRDPKTSSDQLIGQGPVEALSGAQHGAFVSSMMAFRAVA